MILHMFRLGFAMNWKNSNPHLIQQVEYLRVVYDGLSLRGHCFRTQTDLQHMVQRLWRGATAKALTMMQVLGLMATAYPVVPLEMLHMSHLQRWSAK